MIPLLKNEISGRADDRVGCGTPVVYLKGLVRSAKSSIPNRHTDPRWEGFGVKDRGDFNKMASQWVSSPGGSTNDNDEKAMIRWIHSNRKYTQHSTVDSKTLRL